MVFTKRLTNLQIALIKLLEYQVDDRQLLEIKDILAQYFAAEATKGMDRNTHENIIGVAFQKQSKNIKQINDSPCVGFRHLWLKTNHPLCI